MKNLNFKALIPHLIAFVFFLILAFIYAYPVLQGKQLPTHDVVQAAAGATEARTHHEQTGELTHWTNSMFSGMPAYMVYTDYPNSISQHIGRFLSVFVPPPVSLIFLYMACFYIFLLCLNCKPWLSALGAVAFAFGSYNFIIIEAGHYSKVLAVAYAAPIIGGVIMAFRGRYWLGGAITALFVALELYSNHIQITYYLFIALIFLGIFELVYAIRDKRLKTFLTASAVLLVFALVGIGTQANRLLTVYEYTQKSTRGSGELTHTGDNSRAVPASDGLDPEYAFYHSYGLAETFTLLVPELYGGASAGQLSTRSETYSTLTSAGVPATSARDFVSQLPLYWGDQPFTSGPAYAGAIICFLFVFSLIYSRNPLKWWFLTATIFFILMSWGKNLAWFNEFLFYNIPLFNKFRAITMVSSLIHMFMTAMIVLGLRELLEGTHNREETQKQLFTSAGITAGLALFFAIAGGIFFDFASPNDAGLQQNLAQSAGPDFAAQIVNALRNDRASMMRTDAFRSFLFIALAAGLLWFYLRQKVQATWLLGGLLLLTLADLWFVNKRYFSSDDFVAKRQLEVRTQPTPADQQILQDPDPHYRVMDLTRNPFADAIPSQFHKSVGGYHAAKLRRYQDLVERHMSRNNMRVLNMLNTKYFITRGQQGQPVVQRNPDALGNAWFVSQFQVLDTPDLEIAALDTINPATTAVLDRRFASHVEGFRAGNAEGSIRLTEYRPDYLKYVSNTPAEQLAVFSEIYFNEFNDWRVLLDGNEVDHFRVNYVLRAMRVPAGEHTIEFQFMAHTYNRTKYIDLVSSILLVLALGAAFVVDTRNRDKVEPVKEDMRTDKL
jgi:hypothetical protein